MICLALLRQPIAWAFCFALASAGRSMPAKIAMMAMTTSSSMSVKPQRGERIVFRKVTLFCFRTAQQNFLYSSVWRFQAGKEKEAVEHSELPHPFKAGFPTAAE